MKNRDSIVTYGKINVGDPLEAREFEITRDIAANYKIAVQDETPFYLDNKKAEELGLKGEVVPPTLAVLFCRLFPSPPGTIHVGQQYNFIKAMKVGDTIYSTGKIREKFEKKGRKFVLYSVESKNQRGEDVLNASATLILPE